MTTSVNFTLSQLRCYIKIFDWHFIKTRQTYSSRLSVNALRWHTGFVTIGVLSTGPVCWAIIWVWNLLWRWFIEVEQQFESPVSPQIQFRSTSYYINDVFGRQKLCNSNYCRDVCFVIPLLLHPYIISFDYFYPIHPISLRLCQLCPYLNLLLLVVSSSVIRCSLPFYSTSGNTRLTCIWLNIKICVQAIVRWTFKILTACCAKPTLGPGLSFCCTVVDI